MPGPSLSISTTSAPASRCTAAPPYLIAFSARSDSARFIATSSALITQSPQGRTPPPSFASEASTDCVNCVRSMLLRVSGGGVVLAKVCPYLT